VVEISFKNVSFQIFFSKNYPLLYRVPFSGSMIVFGSVISECKNSANAGIYRPSPSLQAVQDFSPRSTIIIHPLVGICHA